jgi:hypothetical protein
MEITYADPGLLVGAALRNRSAVWTSPSTGFASAPGAAVSQAQRHR